MSKIKRSALVIANACKGSPIAAVILVFLYYVAFNFVLALVEKLTFGERFEHWGDTMVAFAFMAYSGICVYYCALINEVNNERA